MLDLRVDVLGGTTIESAAADAVRLATQLAAMVTFSFNDIELYATDTSESAALVAEFLRKARERREGGATDVG